jgi:hypothetical protein
LAPRHSIVDDWAWHQYSLWTFNDTIKRADGDTRFRQYFLLRGLIYRWISLYGVVAKQHSWVWEWFPEGQRWLNAVQTFGADVLNEVIKPSGEKVSSMMRSSDDEYISALKPQLAE